MADKFIHRNYLIKQLYLETDISLTSAVMQIIQTFPTADVQPLSIVAEHIKNRLYETAFNTDDEKASRVIEDMANRIDFWIDELKDGDTNG